MNDYHFYIPKIKSNSVPLMGKFFNEGNNGKRYVVVHSSPKLKQGRLVIAKKKKEYGEDENEERYYITNIEAIHNNKPARKSKVYLETECEHAERKMQIRHFWIPLIVSNLISIAALIVAILAYIVK